MLGSLTGVPPSLLATVQLPAGLTSHKSRAYAITMPKSRIPFPSLQVMLTLPEDTYGKSGANALISLGFHG